MEENAATPARPSATIRRVATGLLLAAVAIYIPARIHEAVHPLVGYVRAFAEAAMVGALADWFAVTALFRHPLGLPIPHTAVIPRNKDRIGLALGRFIERNFLSGQAIASRLGEIDFARHLGLWLGEADNRAAAGARLATFLSTALDALDEAEVARLVRERVGERVRQDLHAGPLIGEILGLLTADNRHQRLVDQLLGQAAALLKDSEGQIRERVSARTAWLWRKLAVDEHVAGQIMGAAEDALTELNRDPQHPWRVRFDETVRDFIRTLKESDAYREEAETFRDKLLAHPVLESSLTRLWGELKEQIRAGAADADSPLRGGLSRWLAGLGEGLLAEPAVRDGLNHWVREVVADLAESRRHDVASLVTETVRGWDPATMSRRIEDQVGNDLQYIRINGTVIGGLAGLAIHALSELFARF